ncbi:glycosyltransferase family A protein [Actinobacillus porcinus]|uniref:Lipooligosaccharide biosynthesis protein n=2 Tax=Actinobacillus porcinus TaxID=51048 RepID=A0ABY6TLI6_9PAST|nr:glycosyltransferase family A protein [Actinobacillus porcinus]MDY5848344.1 glycosyltransferase family A protein [Actinobacillus porcinus]VFY93316.1 Putative lipooligosaccharide biosynthesis protein [Actinobacillus porcinus]VTU08220.1 Putative lipooligosaccharide biosynthesis protein [Actinobacillus porcinus]
MMSENKPLISIIIPCYNAAKYLQETFDSLATQTCQNFEIIAVDDGSTDNTLEILQNIQTKQPKLRIIQQVNQYYIAARINAVKQAQGKYLVFLDADDKLGKDYLKLCSEALENDDSLSIVYTKARFFDARTDSWDLPEFRKKDFLLQNCIYVTAMIRKSEYDAVGGFDVRLKMLEDWELFISLIKRGGKVHRINDIQFYYRKRHNQTSITDQADHHLDSDCHFLLYQKHYDFYKENGIFLQHLFRAKLSDEKRYRKNFLKKYFYKMFNQKKYKKYYG